MHLLLLQRQANTIQLHYWIGNELHNMDAFVQNRCEYEFLGLINEVAAIFKTEIIVETEPLAKGGLKRVYKVISKAEGKKAVITTAVITSLAISIIVTPITSTITKIIDNTIDKIFEDNETKDLQDEKTRLEIEKLKQDIKIDSHRLIQNNNIQLKQFNFYQQLENYGKIEKVSFVTEDELQTKVSDEIFVEAEKYKEFKTIKEFNLGQAIALPKAYRYEEAEEVVTEIKDATIEIKSPDFSSASNKWKGVYNGKSITFRITSSEFNNLVQQSAIPFRKGAKITGVLLVRKIRRKTIYEILSVSNFIE